MNRTAEVLFHMEMDVIGGGSIGLLFAAKLALSGQKVNVWTRTERQAGEINSSGLTLIGESGPTASNIRVASYPVRISGRDGVSSGEPRMALLTVKQAAITEELILFLGELLSHPGSVIICLQNGIGHLEKLEASLPHAEVLAAVTTEGARRINGCSVQHTGRGELWFGKAAPHGAENETGKGENVGMRPDNRHILFLDILNAAGFRSFLSNDMNNRIFQKLLINAVINPLTAIYDVRNGELPEHPLRLRLMEALYEETAALLMASGWKPQGDGWQNIMGVCRATAANVSSMLSDVRAGRPTEIEWINGGIVRLAERLGSKAPLNEALLAIVKKLLPDESGKRCEP
ncbi:ketopantoate reductase family protein [Paenibacillus protaetiae]|nr:2-dehydropantoate 2-reductase [Paenibacillus protaetiae]